MPATALAPNPSAFEFEPSRDLAVPPRRGPGRPSKLTPERHAKIVQLIRGGVPIETAAGSVGISEFTFYEWMQRAEKDGEGTAYYQFSQDVKIARQEREAELALRWIQYATVPQEKRTQVHREMVVPQPDGSTKVIRYLEKETTEVSNTGDWRGIAEFLARQYPERWAKKEGVELTGANGGPVDVRSLSGPVVDSLPTELKVKLIEALEGLQGSQGKVIEGVKAEYREVDLSRVSPVPIMDMDTSEDSCDE